MKKTLLSMALALAALCANAQTDRTFVFCDADGNEIADGTVINTDKVEEDELAGDIMMPCGLYIKNTGTGTTNYAGMSIAVARIDNGQLMHCFPNTCRFYTKAGSDVLEGGERVRVSDGAYPLSSEWFPTAKGQCSVKYTLRSVSSSGDFIGTCSTVTVNYYYGVSAPADKPRIRTFASMGFIIGTISDNGKWVTLYQEVEATKSSQLVNLETGVATDLQTEAEIAAHRVSTMLDVTDDGNIVVGSYEGAPAYYNRAAKVWTKLSNRPGCVRAVTPDGRFAVGSLYGDGTNENDYETEWYTEEYGALWDLATNKEVTLSELTKPYRTPKLEPVQFTRFMAVSPDGRYIMARVLSGAEYFTYLYDRSANGGNGDFAWVGYAKQGDGSWSALDKNMHFCEPKGMSPNGEWLCCDAYMLDGPDEHFATLRYNVKTGACEIFNSTAEDMAMQVNAIDNNGNVYAGTPQGSPIREFYVRSGKYWYSLRSVLKQKYGINFSTDTGLDNTGMPFGVSADGMSFASMCDPQYGENYVIHMNESLVDICSSLNLLGVYTLTPEAGSTFSELNQIKLTFDREVEVVGASTAASFGTWSSLSGNGIHVDPTDSKSVVVEFRSRSLEAGKEYTFSIPAGTIAVLGDQARTNETITCTYVGRTDAPVQVLSAYPAEGTQAMKIDNTSSPVLLTMDCNVLITDNAAAALYTADGQYVCPLIVAYKGNSVALYPASTQYLFDGMEYSIVLEAGSVTDVTGGGANQEYTLHLAGGYVRDVPHDVSTVFADDFNDMSTSFATWMLYEGDWNNPTADMQERFEFTIDTTPWNFSIRDDASQTNFCAASHSMYNPTGASIDWMSTPQLYIPDATCRLTFLGQSYSAAKTDMLKVVVLEKDEAINTIDDEVWEEFYLKGDVVFNQRMDPGATEEGLDGEWTEYTVDLSKYAGKNIYIAFVNENDNQSMVFVDNVRVNRNISFLLGVSTESIVENKPSVVIAGRITANDDATHNTLAMTLRNADGGVVSTINASGLNLAKGQSYNFSFPNPLPLVVGESVRYTIDVDLDGVQVSETGTIKNLSFSPVKRVVLEESTGVTCQNCPQGIIAIGEMERLYGDRFIPISLHSYTGDAWGNGLSGYASYLGILNIAPVGVVGRSGKMSYPMATNQDDEYVTSYNGALWRDLVAAEMEKLTDIDVEATVLYDKDTNVFRVPVKVRSAINTANQNLNIFMVLMEDGLLGLQYNKFASMSDAIFGEWGRGGRYGQSIATNVTHNDVVRACYATSFAGTPGLLPQTYVAGKVYETELSGEVPGVVENVANAKVAVLVIDANTERVVNACVARFGADGNGVDGAAAVQSEGREYSLQGVEVGAGYRGIVIRNGKKYIK